jgi:hypothetical protein
LAEESFAYFANITPGYSARTYERSVQAGGTTIPVWVAVTRKVSVDPKARVALTPAGKAAVEPWTEHVRRCRRCDRDFRVSREAIEQAREHEDYGWGASDVTLATRFSECLTCATGRLHEGEYVADGG